MSEGFLQLRGVTLAYAGTVAVDALDLAVGRSELVGLLGPSGCGKTTTMRGIAGLLTPRAGRIVLDGRDITHVPPNRREIGLMFQSYALFPHLSVRENVAFGLRLAGVAAPERERRVRDALQSVGLTGFEERLPRALSGGQQQRVALARSLVVRPRLLLLDEPLSNLDARLRLEMRSELARLQRELGLPMLYVTHDQTEALALSDRIVVMRAGRIEQQGTPEELWCRPRTGFVARFMGFETILRVEDGQLLASDGSAMAPVPASGAAQALAWRPGQVVLGTGPWQGRVKGASYLGEVVEYLLDGPLGPIKVEAPAGLARHGAGEAVAFDLPLGAAAPLASAD